VLPHTEFPRFDRMQGPPLGGLLLFWVMGSQRVDDSRSACCQIGSVGTALAVGRGKPCGPLSQIPHSAGPGGESKLRSERNLHCHSPSEGFSDACGRQPSMWGEARSGTPGGNAPRSPIKRSARIALAFKPIPSAVFERRRLRSPCGFGGRHYLSVLLLTASVSRGWPWRSRSCASARAVVTASCSEVISKGVKGCPTTDNFGCRKGHAAIASESRYFSSRPGSHIRRNSRSSGNSRPCASTARARAALPPLPLGRPDPGRQPPRPLPTPMPMF